MSVHAEVFVRGDPTVVHTVLGAVEAGEIGIASLNEFVLLALPGWDLAPEAQRFDEAEAYERIRDELARFRQAGGRTIVDGSGIAGGRRADLLSLLSRSTGVHIVASTGFPSELFAPGHFFPDRGRDADYVARTFADEIRTGIVTRGMVRTQSRAGLIRVGYLGWPMTAAEEMYHRAAARASRLTGAAVYSSGDQTNAGALELLLGEGANPSRVVIGHCDDGQALDSGRDRRVVEAGAYVAFDHVGWEDRGLHPGAIPDDARADLVVGFVKSGHVDRVLIAAGAVGARPDGERSSSHGYAHLLESFVPKLRQRGLSEAEVRTILEENPRRLLGVPA